MTVFAADINELALSIFALVVGATLIVTYFASKRVSSATDFWAAGRGLTGVQNGFAIAGDYMSAASFLGIAGLIFLFGFDGFLYSVGFLVAFLTVLFLLAERMRNSGKYTIADVLSFRMKEKPARSGRGARDAERRRLLPDRADGRRGRADPGARGRRLLARGDPHRRLHARLRRRRRHARDQLGADHQGRAADDRDVRAVDLRARQDRLEPARPVPRRRAPSPRRERSTSSRACSTPSRSTRSRSASAWCSAPPACRTS